MKKLIQTVADAVAQLMRFLLRLSDRKAERKEEKERKDVLDLAEEARRSVAEGDEDALNRIIEDRRIAGLRGGQGHAALSVIFAVAMILCSFFLLPGCITSRKTVVIPADRKVVRTELDGISGWFVPDATMADLMESYVVNTCKTEEGY